jgi:hypothetical protein
MTNATVAIIGALLASTPAASPQTTPGAVAAIARLYQDYAAEAVIDSPDLSIADLFGRPKTTLARYLDEELVALVMADRACSARTQGVCNLDFAPIWDSQDPVGTTVKISQGKDASSVLVELRAGQADVRRLTYRMVKSAAGWRVHDIEYGSHPSLVAMLREKP